MISASWPTGLYAQPGPHSGAGGYPLNSTAQRKQTKMIYDNISNHELYKGLTPDIYEGLKFLREADANIANGVYQINPRVKAIVSEYETKDKNEYGYEAHRKNIDIQYQLSGEERIACLPIERLKETKAYNEENDAAFYATDCNIQPSNIRHFSSIIHHTS